MSANRWGRFADWDARPLRLDKFAREDPSRGFAAMSSPSDPRPGVAVAEGRITMMDGVAADDFDMIDRFIAAYHLDPTVVEEAMAIPALELARRLVDMTVPRAELVRLARGLTPARLAEVVGHLNALEIAFAYSKMRARRTPGNQAHVTNAKDDPLQLAADAAIAVALGFDEIETTQRVARNAWSNALACAVGAAVGRWGTLFQCSSEEAEELQIAMRGFTSYAETVSVYGSEGAFVDGDDTPWSKAFLAAAYASRGVKMRATSGAGAELLMGFHQSQSLLYLEVRCLCLQRAMRVQGTQNGGIDGAPVTMSTPGGARELMAETLIAVWLDLECASGNDARPTESEIRVGAVGFEVALENEVVLELLAVEQRGIERVVVLQDRAEARADQVGARDEIGHDLGARRGGRHGESRQRDHHRSRAGRRRSRGGRDQRRRRRGESCHRGRRRGRRRGRPARLGPRDSAAAWRPDKALHRHPAGEAQADHGEQVSGLLAEAAGCEGADDVDDGDAAGPDRLADPAGVAGGEAFGVVRARGGSDARAHRRSWRGEAELLQHGGECVESALAQCHGAVLAERRQAAAT
jgi:Dehydratase large subunit